jgi:hypothetical protein
MASNSEIRFDQAESAHALIGKTLINAKNGKETLVVRLETTNYIISDDNKEASIPAVTLLSYVERGILTVK